LRLFSATSIEIGPAGQIDVDGGDGESSPNVTSGGGGGGSGGTLVLEAPEVLVRGELQAQGGDGGDVSCIFGESAGGAGARITMDGEPGGCGSCPGAGGGGAAGLVVIYAESRGGSGSVIPEGAECLVPTIERECR
jgi:hypothetical protein